MRGQAPVLRLAQQLLLASIIYAQGRANTCQQAPLEGGEGPGNASHRRSVQQAQPPAIVKHLQHIVQ